MIYSFYFEKARIYVNRGRKSLAAIKKETGADVVINGGLYNMATFQPVCHLKVDGKVLAQDQWKYNGFAWNNDEAKLHLTTDYSKYDNYICCVEVVRGGKSVDMYYSEAMGGERGRSAVGTLADGRIAVFCSRDASGMEMTPESLQKYLISKGWIDAVMLDGGGSSQCITPEGNVSSTRIVQNVLCFWLDRKEAKAVTALDKQKVVDIALEEVGYLEKATNSMLDDPKANAGTKNYTKYGLAMGCNGYPWCDAFVDWCFVQAYGWSKAKELLGGFSNSCTISASYLESSVVPINNAQAGDIIFFKDSSGLCHTGIIYNVDNTKLYTVEGNTSSAEGVVENGGCVAKKSYSKTYSRIAKICRPYWDGNKASESISGKIDTVKEVQIWLNNNFSSGLTPDGLYGTLTKKALVKALQKTIGVSSDGIYGTKTNAAVKNLKKGSTGTLVKILQAFLVCNGYVSAYVDGDFGSGTEAALKEYQKKKGLTADGIAGKNTFKALCS